MSLVTSLSRIGRIVDVEPVDSLLYKDEPWFEKLVILAKEIVEKEVEREIAKEKVLFEDLCVKVKKFGHIEPQNRTYYESDWSRCPSTGAWQSSPYEIHKQILWSSALQRELTFKEAYKVWLFEYLSKKVKQSFEERLSLAFKAKLNICCSVIDLILQDRTLQSRFPKVYQDIQKFLESN